MSSQEDFGGFGIARKELRRPKVRVRMKNELGSGGPQDNFQESHLFGGDPNGMRCTTSPLGAGNQCHMPRRSCLGYLLNSQDCEDSLDLDHAM
jgi:hypothetical protein